MQQDSQGLTSFGTVISSPSSSSEALLLVLFFVVDTLKGASFVAKMSISGESISLNWF